MKYLIQDIRSYTGNAATWWCPNGKGYTNDLDKAWKLSKEEIDKQDLRDTDRIISLAVAEKASYRIVDMQGLPAVKRK